MKKVVISMFLVLVLCISTVTASAVGVTPDSQSFNGKFPDGTNIYNQVIKNTDVQPMIFLGYKYVPGYERLVNLSYIYAYSRIYGTSIHYIAGTIPTYTLTVTSETTKATTWNVSGNFEGGFDIKAVKAKLTVAGGYSSTNTAKVSAGETWNCGFTTPGTYNLTWYMRGHSYNAQCGVEVISTGSDNGDFRYYNLGRVIFPTKEIHFDVSRGY